MMGNTDWTPGSDRQLIREYQTAEDGTPTRIIGWDLASGRDQHVEGKILMTMVFPAAATPLREQRRSAWYRFKARLGLA